ncbi:2-hydroxychromene-2-carboxylate isomerase [Bradyrhizobium sp. USDA 4461]
MNTKPRVEFWFEFGSMYSYLSVMRMESEATRFGVSIAWKPFLLGPVFQALGLKENPFLAHKRKLAYAQHDLERQCRKYGLKWIEQTTFPRLGLLPLRIALIGSDEPWMASFCRSVMELNYGTTQDINDPAVVSQVLEALKLPSANLLELAKAEETKSRLREQTELAFKKGIFGAPTFIAGDELFWGNDRMAEAFEFVRM